MTRLLLMAAISILITLVAAVVLPSYLIPAAIDKSTLARRRTQLEVVRVIAEILAGSLFLVTLFAGWQQLRGTQDQLEIARRGQVTERFTRAVDQLGATQSTVRAGGTYALEGIARDSSTDQRTVMELLATFLRSSAPADETFEGSDWQAVRGTLPPPDVAAAASVIGRRDVQSEETSDTACDPLGGPFFRCVLTLRSVDLGGMTLTEARFDHVDLARSSFNFTNLAFAHLRGANLAGADLRGANLRLADLTGARLQGARLEKTNLHSVVGLTCEQLKSAYRGGEGAANLTIDCRMPRQST